MFRRSVASMIADEPCTARGKLQAPAGWIRSTMIKGRICGGGGAQIDAHLFMPFIVPRSAAIEILQPSRYLAFVSRGPASTTVFSASFLGSWSAVVHSRFFVRRIHGHFDLKIQCLPKVELLGGDKTKTVITGDH